MKKKEEILFPDFLFEVSWEVCNKVGGIYAVLSTKAATLKQKLGDGLVFVGPDIWFDQESPFFLPNATTTLQKWADQANRDGLKVRVGRWNIPGEPQVVLVDFRPFYSEKNAVYAQMWEWYGVNSMPAYGDYDEGCIFAYASARIIESMYINFCPQRSQVVAHFNEWTTGMGVLYLNHKLPSVATMFTTHATCIGRSICGNNKPLYDYLQGYNGDQMAEELNMVSKHSIEKRAAQTADCFTTVSDITAAECNQLLERLPLVTPNGFENSFVPKGATMGRTRKESRKVFSRIVECLVGYKPESDALFIGTAGRCEFKNKGIDAFLDTLARLRNRPIDREVIGFIMVPGWVQEPRADVKERFLSNDSFSTPCGDPVFTHAVHNYFEDVILNRIHQLGFQNRPEDKVKVIYIPCYLNGDDGLLNRSYYSMLAGLDLTIYPSYYEPWGYTPMESCAFSVPTITTSLSGFGMWCKSIGKGASVSDGVVVVPRSDSGYEELVNRIADHVINVCETSSAKYKEIGLAARKIAQHTEWKYFIQHYLEAYDKALHKVQTRVR